MSMNRERYVPPAVLRFDYEVDPRVTLALTCKDTNAGSGAVRAGCLQALSSNPCSDITPS